MLRLLEEVSKEGIIGGGKSKAIPGGWGGIPGNIGIEGGIGGIIGGNPGGGNAGGIPGGIGGGIGSL